MVVGMLSAECDYLMNIRIMNGREEEKKRVSECVCCACSLREISISILVGVCKERYVDKDRVGVIFLAVKY